MKPYTKEQLLEKSIKMGYNKIEAKKAIERSYTYYIEHHSDYNLTKAAKYCIGNF